MGAPTEHEFRADQAAPAAARTFARTTAVQLLGPDVDATLCDDVELIVSELVTNAVRAGSPTVLVSLAIESERMVVRITDAAAGWPEAREAGIHDTGGRGLPLVSALSASWGVRMNESGKTVWAELTLPQPA